MQTNGASFIVEVHVIRLGAFLVGELAGCEPMSFCAILGHRGYLGICYAVLYIVCIH